MAIDLTEMNEDDGFNNFLGIGNKQKKKSSNVNAVNVFLAGAIADKNEKAAKEKAKKQDAEDEAKRKADEIIAKSEKEKKDKEEGIAIIEKAKAESIAKDVSAANKKKILIYAGIAVVALIAIKILTNKN